MDTLFISSLLLIQFISVESDCGLPAIPPNAKINDFNSQYLEDTKIEYYCELPELELLGGKVRVCKNGQWIGTIPRCAEEIGANSIERIEIKDSSGKSENNSNPIKSTNGRAFTADLTKGECIAARGGSLKPVTFRIHLTGKFRHLTYFEILLHVGKETNSTKEILEIFTNTLRTCIPTVAEPAISPSYLLRLKVICDLETASDDETYYNYYNMDITKNITIKFDSSTVAVCEIRIFYRKFHSFHRCGSADFPLYSSVDFVRIGSKYGSMPYYRFSCDKSFELVGNSDVRCGINNYWLDEFPTCRPKITCSIPPEKDVGYLTLRMNYNDLFVYDSALIAIPGSKVTYECDKFMNSSKFIMIGDSVRVCNQKGVWTGIEPYCVEINELKLEKYSELFEEKVAIETELPIKSEDESRECGLPGLPVFAKPTPGRLGPSGDFRSSYPNGTKMSYRCESAFHWMFPYFDTRTCIDGKWIGNIGKCEINYGGKLALKSIVISNYDSSKQINEWIRPKRVKPSGLTDDENEFGSYNAFSGWLYEECVPINLTEKQKWSLNLNDTQPISGFVITLRPGGIYGGYKSPKALKNITQKPITAKIGRIFCDIGFVSDYPKHHSTINYRCDRDSTLDYSSYSTGINEIVLYVDPTLFDSKYDINNFTLCSLTVYHSTDNCGTPDKPLHSIVKVENQIAKYSCEDGYQLIGPQSVSCLRNGKWSEDFPVCKLKRDLCSRHENNGESELLFKYQNTINNGSIVLETLIKYQCSNTSSYRGRSILVGSRTRICQSNGQWSGSKPFCIDSAIYESDSGSSQDSTNFSVIFVILLSVGIISLLVLLIVGIILLYRRGIIKISNILHKNQNSSSTATLPVRPESKVSICEINATIDQLSCFPSTDVSDNKSKNNRLRIDRTLTNK